MHITDIETFVVGNPPPGFGGRYFIFVKLTTNNGIEGYGEIYCATFGPDVVTKMAEDMAARYFIGSDPFQTELLFRRVYGSGYSARPDVSVMGVFSGLEMACWDLMGKSVDLPAYALLGGKVHENSGLTLISIRKRAMYILQVPTRITFMSTLSVRQSELCIISTRASQH
jgi:galactonate dehydratase